MNTMRNGSPVTGVRNQLAKILALMLALALVIPGALAMYPAVSADAQTGKATSPSPPLIDRLRQAAAAKAAPSVVRVSHAAGLGSGVIVKSNGYIVTNYHVVAQAAQLTVTLANGKSMPASLTGTDPVDDLAVIKVNAQHLPAAALADSSKLQVGQSVLAIGNPLGISTTVTEGIVSALDRTVSEGDGAGSILNAVQTSAAINPGNSGGALIDLQGRVIGIPTLAAIDPTFGAPASGVGFAIPSNVVQRIVPQLIDHGKVLHSDRAALGIQAQSVSPQIAAQFNLSVSKGVLVATVGNGSAANKAGIKAGDIIVKVNGSAIESSSDLFDVLAKKKPGDTVKVSLVDTNAGQRTVTVTLGELPVSEG